MPSTTVFLLIACLYAGAYAQAPRDIASAYNLATSTSFPIPSSTASSEDTQELIIADWSLGKGRIQENGDNLRFVADPFPTSNRSAPVLRVLYPADSYTHATGGGTQFYNLWNATDDSKFETMLLSYDLAFDSDFDWVKGGKLPGLRGGLASTGCSGGKLPTGKECFSSRLMWRKGGSGEVYAYIQKSNDLCDRSDVGCNEDFGISIDRKSFTFATGVWQRLSLLVQLNNPPNVANGNIQFFYNDQHVLSQDGLQIRTADNLTINGLFFSTFFGGADDSFATPKDVHAYFRNITLWGSSRPSNLTGPVVSSAPSPNSPISLYHFAYVSLMGLLLAL